MQWHLSTLQIVPAAKHRHPSIRHSCECLSSSAHRLRCNPSIRESSEIGLFAPPSTFQESCLSVSAMLSAAVGSIERYCRCPHTPQMIEAKGSSTDRKSTRLNS